MGAVPAGGNVWKTILIGVVTTVCAYIIVNLIFSNKGKKEGFKKKKEATINAWKAIVKSNEFYLDDFYSSFCEKDDKSIVHKLSKAIDKQISDYELMQKKPDLDDDLGLYINRYLDRGKDLRAIIQELFDASKTVENDTSLTVSDKQTRLKQLDSTYVPRLLALPSQDSDRIALLHKDLTERYGDHFKAFQREAASEEAISGKWREGTNKFFTLNKDNSLLMTVDGTDYNGTWSISDNVITLKFNDNSSVDYNISFYGPGYIWFKVNDTGADRLLCRR